MTLPRQIESITPDRAGTASYNFVPLPERVVTVVPDARHLPRHDTFAHSGHPHTGWFDVMLTTRSPLYIRGGLSTTDIAAGSQLSEWALAEEQKAGRSVGEGFRDLIKNKPAFFHTQNEDSPILPGSSLRGMLRLLLEIVSYGKMTPDRVADRHLIYRAVGDMSSLGSRYRDAMLGSNQATGQHMQFEYPQVSVKGGYLCRQTAGWGIRPALADAARYNESFVHVEYQLARSIGIGRGGQNFHPVYVTPAPRRMTQRSRWNLKLNLAASTTIASRSTGSSLPAGMAVATLVESGHLGTKHMHCAIYEEDTSAGIIPIPPEMWADYEADRDMTRGHATRVRKLTSHGQPLFFQLNAIGGLEFFGPTMMFRLRYKQTVQDMIPPFLRRPLDVDYADALFGFVRGKQDFRAGPAPDQGDCRRAYAGRVSVTDGTLSSDPSPEHLWLMGNSANVLEPQILASSKPNSFQNYLVQTTGRSDNLRHYDSATPHETVVRGHKLNWHRGDRVASDLRPPSGDPNLDAQGEVKRESTQHTRIAPIRSGNCFRFRVYFDNLSNAELGALCWALHPAGDSRKDYAHWLGMGKPLGMGAVKLNARLCLTDRSARYRTLFDGNEWGQGVSGLGEDLSDLTVLDARTKPFEEHVLQTLFDNNPPPEVVRLRDLERIGILLKMMEMEPNLPPGSTRTLTLTEFRGRRILPSPAFYGPLTGQKRPPAPSIQERLSDLPTDEPAVLLEEERELERQERLEIERHEREHLEAQQKAERLEAKRVEELREAESLKKAQQILEAIQAANRPNFRQSVDGPQPPPSTGKIKAWVRAADSRKGWRVRTLEGEQVLITIPYNHLPPPNEAQGVCQAELTYRDGKLQSAKFVRWSRAEDGVPDEALPSP